MLLLLSTLAFAQPPIAGTWALTDGWVGMEMVLAPPGAVDREEDWIGIVFTEDGRISWEPLRYPDPAVRGCSNAFGGFSGQWQTQRGRTLVTLHEENMGGVVFSGEFVVTTLTTERLVLTPSLQ